MILISTSPLTDYLLSNNHVNSIIVHKFDFSDEEIMAYYLSFLKTLSLKLNNHTVHFFYNEVRPRRDGWLRENKEGHNGEIFSISSPCCTLCMAVCDEGRMSLKNDNGVMLIPAENVDFSQIDYHA